MTWNKNKLSLPNIAISQWNIEYWIFILTLHSYGTDKGVKEEDHFMDWVCQLLWQWLLLVSTSCSSCRSYNILHKFSFQTCRKNIFIYKLYLFIITLMWISQLQQRAGSYYLKFLIFKFIYLFLFHFKEFCMDIIMQHNEYKHMFGPVVLEIACEIFVTKATCLHQKRWIRFKV